MPNIIPPIVSSSPPPLDPVEDDDENDDDFGDFAVADFPSHNDFEPPSTISDTSWKPPVSNSLKPQNHEDKELFVRDASDYETRHTLPKGGLIEDLCQDVDDTSHESVVPPLTDSGNCSGSQNSSGASPMPSVECEEDVPSNQKFGCSYQNGLANQINGLSEEAYERCPTSSVDHSSSINLMSRKDDASEQQDFRQELAISASSQSDCHGVIESSSGINFKVSEDTSRIEMETDQGFQAPIHKPISCTSSSNVVDEGNIDEFENRISSEDKKDVSSGTILSDEQFEDTGSVTQSHLDTSDSDIVPKNPEIEDEFVKAMILPVIPGLHDEFGEFSGMANDSCVSGALADEDNNMLFESPSRRPTLVLSDENVEASLIYQPLSSYCDINLDVEKSGKNYPTSKNSQVDLGEDETSLTNDDFHTDEAFGDFADFTQAQDNDNTATSNWAPLPTNPSVAPRAGPSELELDDFDDFESAEFQSADMKQESVSNSRNLFDLQSIQSSVQELLKQNFPIARDDQSASWSNMPNSGLSGIILDIEENPVWQGLRDLEATPSLSFLWPGSHSNRGLLGALNIDSRNILFGPKWNTVVPRFAANLGFSPLEPVRAVQSQPVTESTTRTEVIQPQVLESIKSSSSDSVEVVPAAQFDWSDSGLINPLDSNKDPLNGPLATTTASGNPALSSTPIQVEQLLASSERLTSFVSLEKKGRDPSLSPEAVRVLDTLPELAFLSARMLMFPVQGDSSVNKL